MTGSSELVPPLVSLSPETGPTGGVPWLLAADGLPAVVPVGWQSPAEPFRAATLVTEEIGEAAARRSRKARTVANPRSAGAAAPRKRGTGQPSGERKRRPAAARQQVSEAGSATRQEVSPQRAPATPQAAVNVTSTAMPADRPVVTSPPPSARVAEQAPTWHAVASPRPPSRVTAPPSIGWPQGRAGNQTGAGRALLVGLGIFLGALLVVSALQQVPRARPMAVQDAAQMPPVSERPQPPMLPPPVARHRDAGSRRSESGRRASRSSTPKSPTSTSRRPTWTQGQESWSGASSEPMQRVDASVDVTARVFELQPPQPRRALVFPQVVRRLLATYQGAHVVVVVAVDSVGNAHVDSVEAGIPLSDFVRARFEHAALESGWRPATDELGKPVSGTRRVDFVVY